MDRGDKRDIIIEYLKKYRWAAVVLLAGLILMALPENEMEAVVPEPEAILQQESLQQELEILLSRLDGAGAVKVLLSTASGPETYYQTDEDEGKTDTSADKRSETVLITSSDRSEMGLVRRVDPPVYLGAVVLCQGADRAQVKLAVVDAVATATGLTTDKISVWKMK